MTNTQRRARIEEIENDLEYLSADYNSSQDEEEKEHLSERIDDFIAERNRLEAEIEDGARNSEYIDSIRIPAYC